jgi:ubiquitin C-terminal hydrolase
MDALKKVQKENDERQNGVENGESKNANDLPAHAENSVEKDIDTGDNDVVVVAAAAADVSVATLDKKKKNNGRKNKRVRDGDDSSLLSDSFSDLSSSDSSDAAKGTQELLREFDALSDDDDDGDDGHAARYIDASLANVVDGHRHQRSHDVRATKRQRRVGNDSLKSALDDDEFEEDDDDDDDDGRSWSGDETDGEELSEEVVVWLNPGVEDATHVMVPDVLRHLRTQSAKFKSPSFELCKLKWNLLFIRQSTHLSLYVACEDDLVMRDGCKFTLSGTVRIALPEILPNEVERPLTEKQRTLRDRVRSVSHDIVSRQITKHHNDQGWERFVSLAALSDAIAEFDADRLIVLIKLRACDMIEPSRSFSAAPSSSSSSSLFSPSLSPYGSTSQFGSHGWDSRGAIDTSAFSKASRADQFVGLRNQGATCYLNSLMQALFHIGAFRRAVYQMPSARPVAAVAAAAAAAATGDGIGDTGKGDAVRLPAQQQQQHQSTATDKQNVALALQRLFFRLQTSKAAVSTKELTASFGWSSAESFVQHDVHELNSVLMENLEKKMKDTVVDGEIARLFRGRLINFIECIEVPFKSERSEDFYDLSLVVKGCANIYESLNAYIEVEKLDGENKYQTDDERYGLQDARKGIRFEQLPPVLCVQLKRWEMDLQTFQSYKVNDRHEFYPVIDLSEYLPDFDDFDDFDDDDDDDGRSKGDRADSIYHLHAVCVHSGGTHGGHYFAFVKPSSGPLWYKFNDATVTRATDFEAIDENFGSGGGKTRSHGGCANAYMLVYVRSTEVATIMNDQCLDVIPEHLQSIAEEHLWTTLCVATRSHLEKHDPLRFDLIVDSEFCKVRVKRTWSMAELGAELERRFDVPATRQRLFSFSARRNGTLRPTSPVNSGAHATVGALLRNDSLKVLLDDIASPFHVQQPVPMAAAAAALDGKAARALHAPVLIAIKYYDPLGVDAFFFVDYVVFPASAVRTVGVLRDVVANVLAEHASRGDGRGRFASLAVDEVSAGGGGGDASMATAFDLYEEVRHDSCLITALKDDSATLASAEISCGDVVVAVPRMRAHALDRCAYPSPGQFCEFVRDRIVVSFAHRAHPHMKRLRFELQLDKTATYDNIAEVAGGYLGCPPQRVLLKGNPVNVEHGGALEDPRPWSSAAPANTMGAHQPTYTRFGEIDRRMTLESMLNAGYGRRGRTLYYEATPCGDAQDYKRLARCTVRFGHSARIMVLRFAPNATTIADAVAMARDYDARIDALKAAIARAKKLASPGGDVRQLAAVAAAYGQQHVDVDGEKSAARNAKCYRAVALTGSSLRYYADSDLQLLAAKEFPTDWQSKLYVVNERGGYLPPFKALLARPAHLRPRHHPCPVVRLRQASQFDRSPRLEEFVMFVPIIEHEPYSSFDERLRISVREKRQHWSDNVVSFAWLTSKKSICILGGMSEPFLRYADFLKSGNYTKCCFVIAIIDPPPSSRAAHASTTGFNRRAHNQGIKIFN